MTKRLLPTILIIVGFIAAVAGPLPDKVQAQTPLAQIKCPTESQRKVEAGAANTDQKNTRAIAHNFLARAFTYNNLSHRLRCDPLIVGATDDEGVIIGGPSIYNVSKNLVNFGVLMVLLVIAFANILRIKLDTYAVKKAVPLLLFGVVMANLSLPVIRSIVDFSGVLTATFIGEAGLPGEVGTREVFVKNLIETVYVGGLGAIGDTLSGLNDGSPWQGILLFLGTAIGIGIIASAFTPFLLGLLLLALFLWTLPAILFMWLGLLFIARIYVLVILAAVSPLAFATLGFEPLKGKVWGWWWTHFTKWTFMAPATFALMWVAIRFHQSVAGNPDIGTYIISLVMLSLAVQMPMKMGGSIMSTWSKFVGQPVKDFALKGFQTGGQAIGVGANRAMSQPTKLPKFLGGKTLPPTNLKRIYGEYSATREKRAAAEDAKSPAGQFGRRLGSITAERVRTARKEGKVGGLFTEDYNFSAADKEADEIIDSTVGKGTLYVEIKDQKALVDNINHAMEEALASGNADRIIGAYMANAKMGKVLDDKQQKRFLDALRQMGRDTSVIEVRYKRAFGVNEELGQLGAATPQEGRSDMDVKQGFIDELGGKVQLKTGDKLIQSVQAMSNSFTDIRDENNNPIPMNSPAYFKAIEDNSTLYGYAHVALKTVERLSKSKNQAEVQLAQRIEQNSGFQAIRRQKGRFMAGNVADVSPKTAHILNQSNNPAAKVQHAQILVRPGAIQEGGDWMRLQPEEQETLREIYKQVDDVKKDLAGKLKTRLEEAAGQAQVTDANDIKALGDLADSIVNTATPKAMPSSIESRASDIIAHAKDEAKGRSIINQLRDYDNYVNNLNKIHEVASADGWGHPTP